MLPPSAIWPQGHNSRTCSITACVILAVRTCIPKCANTRPVNKLESVVGASFLTTMDPSLCNQGFLATMVHSFSNQSRLTTKGYSLGVGVGVGVLQQEQST